MAVTRATPSPRPLSATAGVTLFETLIALSILALVLGVAATALRGPSPSMLLEQQAAAFTEAAATARARAVNGGETVELELPGCDGRPVIARFHSDGTATGSEACVSGNSLSLTLRISPLTGRLAVDRSP